MHQKTAYKSVLSAPLPPYLNVIGVSIQFTASCEIQLNKFFGIMNDLKYVHDFISSKKNIIYCVLNVFVYRLFQTCP